MGLFDWFWKEGPCPQCGAAGAKVWGHKVRCPNRECRHFDRDLMHAVENGRPAAQVAPARPRATVGGTFDPGAHAIEIRYVNFEGVEQTFVGDRRTVRRGKKHISIVVAPSGKRITLRMERMRNRPEIEEAARAHPEPTGDERRIMMFHLNRGSTSPLYEEIRARYPDWRA